MTRPLLLRVNFGERRWWVPALALVAIGTMLVSYRRSLIPEPKRGPTRFATPAVGNSAEVEATPPVLPPGLALSQRYTLNQSAFIPPQCYTKTVDEQGKAHNPCYTCHVSSRAPNYLNDADVQLAYAFVPRARKNAWTNLFIDWAPRISMVSDDEIQAHVRKSNYFDGAGGITLAQRLASLPPEWDHGGDGKWSGYVPDVQFRFDERGFDRLQDGGYTGWRAFAYYPVPGTFWPTNGSMGDVLIRLPAAFREGDSGQFQTSVYELNLAIIEALITRRDVEIESVNETLLAVDLDQDGKLAKAERVAFRDDSSSSPPRSSLSYVGRARTLLSSGELRLAEGLFPQGTEFLHTVRYLDPTDSGIQMAARLKELRYAKKTEWMTAAQLKKRADAEAIAKVDSPSELRNFGGDIERGVSNNQGWYFQGFIEDEQGELRPQSFEEHVYCTGCHSGIGAVDDGIFSFGRRLGRDTFQEGWYHWSQRGLDGVADRPIHGGGGTEYVTYLELNGAGDEFRQNDEVIERFFDDRGELLPEMKQRVERDISVLILPSRERALALNKAYWLLTKQQTFRLGREIVLDGGRNLHRTVDPDQETGVLATVAPTWGVSRLEPKSE